ncbi:hypothetical protein B0H17DRAFT_1178517 [Mycena rosella]|uniref:Uncharacterized protein n=1 Tax=Mycena rosella TaxID=1033263 RepID=A0AAD7DQ00_MYCRO|nr:hypothetical protein B0H17DRAFT_1178517 [Mycena rosella]
MIFTANKSVLACASIFLALAAQTSAHAMPTVALGVKGAPARSDVQRPSTAKPCGSIDPASTLDTSTAVAANADGTVDISVVNFNAGADGSTSVSVQVDATGVGNKFVAGTVKTNGNAKPSKVETDKVVFSLPAGTKCAGGKAKNLCLVSVKTTAGFGACMVVSQGTAAAAPPPPAKTTAAAVKTTTTAAAVKATTTAAAKTTAKATTTTAAAKSTTSAASNKDTTNKAGAAKNQSGATKKKHHHHKGKGKGKGKGTKKGKAAASKSAAPAAKASSTPAAAVKKTMPREVEASRLFLREVIEQLEAQRREYEMDLE